MVRETSFVAHVRNTSKQSLRLPNHILASPRYALFAMAFLHGWAQPCLLQAREPDKRVRTIYHENGRKTLSEKDNNTGVLNEYTYDERNALLLHKQFQIDRKGRARRGQVFDAKQNLLARVEYGFDEFGRVEEERMFDAKGNVIRRLLYSYDSQGKKLRPVAYTYSPGESAPRRVDPERLPQTIVTPNINGVREIPGNRYEEGGMREVPGVSPRPIRR